MFESQFGSYHSDLLSAAPEDDAGKERLVETIKERAKKCVSTKSYPEAIQLYSKGIEVLPTNAILYANRSMCHLGMGKAPAALEDAEKALEFDSAYVKGHYRKAMALIALKKNGAAKEAIEKGLLLAPEDKDLLLQLKKVESDVAVVDTKKPSPTSTPTRQPVIPKPESAVPQKKEESAKGEQDMDIDEEASLIRGYKKTSDGRTTSYFTNELDDNTKALIGNIAPKKIDVVVIESETTSAVNGSAWNTAGTVETVTHSPWATRRLEELLAAVKVKDVPEAGSVVIKKVKSVSGDAEVMFVRGKRKNVYDMAAELEWAVRAEDGAELAEGTISLSDISADLDLEVSVTIKSNNAAVSDVVKTYVKGAGKGLQPAIVRAISSFVEEFKTK
jgi:tetratricopeptide (TPR) repeat protein